MQPWRSSVHGSLEWPPDKKKFLGIIFPLTSPKFPAYTPPMLANKDSTSQTMLEALAHTIGALKAAKSLDIDRSPEDHAFFDAERAALEPLFNELFDADSAEQKHRLMVTKPNQGAIEVGDAVLDRGARRNKKRMSLELQTIAPDAADNSFGENIRDLVDAERHLEPALVLGVVDKYKYVPDFPGKAESEADLIGRATRQKDNFLAREAGQVQAAALGNKSDALVAQGADALYRLEKRMLERFPREKAYVAAFFMDVGYKRPRKSEGQGAPEGGTTP